MHFNLYLTQIIALKDIKGPKDWCEILCLCVCVCVGGGLWELMKSS